MLITAKSAALAGVAVLAAIGGGTYVMKTDPDVIKVGHTCTNPSGANLNVLAGDRIRADREHYEAVFKRLGCDPALVEVTDVKFEGSIFTIDGKKVQMFSGVRTDSGRTVYFAKS